MNTPPPSSETRSNSSASGNSGYKESNPLHGVLSSTFSLLDQTPPPSLREIISAYRSRSSNEEDRELLLAMLNAKTAEDQRLSSTASLYKSVLELYRVPVIPMSQHPGHLSQPYESASHTSLGKSSHSTLGVRRKRDDDELEPSPDSKRAKESPRTTSAWDGAPPSPRSPSQSEAGSPRIRKSSMAIGSLLSTPAAPPRPRKNSSSSHYDDSDVES